MNIEQIAVQLYTLRDYCKTETDYAATLKRVREMGYQAVQISGSASALPPERIASIAKDEGLFICSTHEDPNKVINTPAEIIERLKAIGAKHTAYPYPANVDLTNAGEVKKMIDGLEAAAHLFAAAGLVLSYHNHANEFYRLNGKTVIESIYEDTTCLQAELDTFWVARGGQDCVSWINRVAGRMDVIHFKDFAVTTKGESYHTWIGGGNLDWKGIAQACDATGVKWVAVEQDSVQEGECPFVCLKSSFDFIRDNLCS